MTTWTTDSMLRFLFFTAFVWAVVHYRSKWTRERARRIQFQARSTYWHQAAAQLAQAAGTTVSFADCALACVALEAKIREREDRS